MLAWSDLGSLPASNIHMNFARELRALRGLEWTLDFLKERRLC